MSNTTDLQQIQQALEGLIPGGSDVARRPNQLRPRTNVRIKGRAMSLALSSLFVVASGTLFGNVAWAQSTADVDHPPAILPVQSEAAPKIIAYAPLAEPLARGVAIIQFRTESLRIMPVFGKTAGEVSPRLGHLHVTVDNWPGGWAHTSVDPVIVNALAPGPHKVLLEIADPTHKIITSTTVNFVVPERNANEPHAH